jgi:EamA domain-containing membrane protein RarD
MMAPYVALLGVQTIGAVALCWTGLPLYRQVLADPSSHEVYAWAIVWNLLSIILMQIAYCPFTLAHHCHTSKTLYSVMLFCF